MSKYTIRRDYRGAHTAIKQSKEIPHGWPMVMKLPAAATAFPYAISVLFPYQLTHETRYQVILRINSLLSLH
jgi:hypothetical protein